MIDPDKAPKFSDTFDRAQAFSNALTRIEKTLDAIDSKIDTFTDRLVVVETEERLTRALSVVASALSVVALVIAVVGLVITLTS